MIPSQGKQRFGAPSTILWRTVYRIDDHCKRRRTQGISPEAGVTVVLVGFIFVFPLDDLRDRGLTDKG